MNITLLALNYYDTVSSTTGTAYVGTHAFVTEADDEPANAVFEPRVDSLVVRRAMFADGTTTGRSVEGSGELVLTNTDGGLDGWRNYAFDARTVTQYDGPADGVFPTDFTETVWTVDRQPDISTTSVRFQLVDRLPETKVPLQATKYDGDNVLPAGLEGTEDLKGKPKPWCFGDVFNVPAVCVNTSKLIYQVHDGAVAAISDVRDRGVSLEQTVQAWEELDNGADTTDFRAAALKGTDIIVLGGVGGVIRVSTDGGANFSTPTSPFTTGSAGSAPSLVASGTVGGDGISSASTSRTSSVTVPVAGDNKLLIAAISITGSSTSGDSVTAVSSDVDGALTKLDHSEDPTGTQCRAEIWYLKNPTAGAHVITATYAASTRSIICAHVFQDVYQTTPFGTVAKANTTTDAASPATVTVSSAAGETVIDVVAKRNSTDDLTVGASQTERHHAMTSSATASQNIIGGLSTEAGGASVTMSWTYSNNYSWATLGVPLKNVPAAVSDIECGCYDPVLDAFYLGATNGELGYSDDDGSTWALITGGDNPFSSTETITGMASDGAGTVVAVGDEATIGYTTDVDTFADRTHTWSGTPAFTSVCFGHAGWLITTATETSIAPTMSAAPGGGPAANVSGMPIIGSAYGLGHYVIVCASGASTTVASSETGQGWTVRHNIPATAGTLGATGIAFGGPRRAFVVSGTHNTTDENTRLLVSQDVLKWDVSVGSITAGNTNPGRAVAANSEQLVVACDNGKVETPARQSTYASESDLLDDDLAPEPGTFKAYLAGGYFRLGSSPAGLVTADVLQGANAAARTAGQGFAAVMSKIGLGSDYSTSDVTTLDSARTDVIGFWSGLQEWKANDVLDLIANSVEAWWGPDSSGVFRIQLGPTTSGTSVLDIAEEDLLEPLRFLPTQDADGGLPAYLVTVRYRKNYAVQDMDLAAGVSEANRALYAKEWREEPATSAAVQTAFAKAREAIFETLLATSANAASSATRRLAVYDSRQDIAELVIELNEESRTVDIGDVVTPSHSRFSLSAGVDVATIGLEMNVTGKRLTIRGWRAA